MRFLSTDARNKEKICHQICSLCTWNCLVNSHVAKKTLRIGYEPHKDSEVSVNKSNRKAMNRNWSNQKANPALKTKTTLLSEQRITVCYNETKDPVYKSVRKCRYQSIRKLETRHVNLKPPPLRSVGFMFTCRVSNFRIDLTSIL